MRRLRLALLALACFAPACKTRAEQPDPDAARFEGPVVNDFFETLCLRFRIGTSYEAQRRSPVSPWHEPGGEWTFYEAKTDGGVTFGFALHDRGGGDGFNFGDVMLTVPDAAAGAALVEDFARTFHATVPPPKAAQPLRFAPFSAAILATGAIREKGGGFSHGAGHWIASKLILQRSGPEAEVFFNFDPVAQIGEFCEKDAEYRDPMIAFLATELRDGPRARQEVDSRGPRRRQMTR